VIIMEKAAWALTYIGMGKCYTQMEAHLLRSCPSQRPPRKRCLVRRMRRAQPRIACRRPGQPAKQSPLLLSTKSMIARVAVRHRRDQQLIDHYFASWQLSRCPTRTPRLANGCPHPWSSSNFLQQTEHCSSMYHSRQPKALGQHTHHTTWLGAYSSATVILGAKAIVQTPQNRQGACWVAKERLGAPAPDPGIPKTYPEHGVGPPQHGASLQADARGRGARRQPGRTEAGEPLHGHQQPRVCSTHSILGEGSGFGQCTEVRSKLEMIYQSIPPPPPPPLTADISDRLAHCNFSAYYLLHFLGLLFLHSCWSIILSGEGDGGEVLGNQGGWRV